ncbi:hypothetical protein T484DRAFT_1858558, partial [Baffinella frigidus]
MDTGSVQNIQGVATQGRGDGQPQWVGSYKVSVSNDEISWVAVDGGFTFTGNTVQGDAIVRNNFAAVVTARSVAFMPASEIAPAVANPTFTTDNFAPISFGTRPSDRVWVAATQDVNQGRGDGVLQWVSSYTVSVSNDSITWVAVDGDGPAGTVATHGLTFTGNTGIGDTVVRNNFAAPVTGRYVRIEPYEWSGLISMRAGVYIGSVPTYGLETFSPPEATFSSIWDGNAIKPAISIATAVGTAWIAHSGSMDLLQWLAMDTGSVQNIEGVATQGRGGDTEDQWVSSYTVSVSDDKISWVAVDGGFTFTGNTGRGDAVVRNNFAAVVTARYVRIEPVTWTGYIAMRAGVYVERGGVGECVDNAACSNVSSSLTCLCNDGFFGSNRSTGDALVCTDMQIVTFNNALNAILVATPAYGIYSASAFDGSTLRDLSGNERHAALTAGTVSLRNVSGHGASNVVAGLAGDTTAKMLWPAGSIPATFTVCSVTRYDETGSTFQRILQGSDSPAPAASLNWFQGHEGGMRGVVHYSPSGWMSPFPTGGNSTDWAVMCGTNGGAHPGNIVFEQ